MESIKKIFFLCDGNVPECKKHSATNPAVNVDGHRTSDTQSILRMLVNMVLITK